jgi:hypothetical protein
LSSSLNDQLHERGLDAAAFMRYLCLVRDVAQLSNPERGATVDELRRSGHLLMAEALEPPSAGVLVRVRGGLVSLTAGAPTEEHPIVAFFLLDARDLNEAIHLAARDPAARHGVIEVRPLRPIE